MCAIPFSCAYGAIVKGHEDRPRSELIRQKKMERSEPADKPKSARVGTNFSVSRTRNDSLTRSVSSRRELRGSVEMAVGKGEVFSQSDVSFEEI